MNVSLKISKKHPISDYVNIYFNKALLTNIPVVIAMTIVIHRNFFAVNWLVAVVTSIIYIVQLNLL